VVRTDEEGARVWVNRASTLLLDDYHDEGKGSVVNVAVGYDNVTAGSESP
jgi:hypothetical protein